MTVDAAPSFRTSKADFNLIKKIAVRAREMALHMDRENERSLTDFHMDIAACHANGNPLRLDALLAADDFNFAHDVFGIERHLNRDTGKLMDFFSPRFSSSES
jgi:hypothetical protein